MKLSTDRILTTHVGSLPRPVDLVELLSKEDREEPVDEAILHQRVSEAVKEIVKKQTDAGIDIIGDGEMSKMSYHVYAKHRLTGLGNVEGSGVPGRKIPLDIQDFPEMILEPLGGGGTELLQSTVCKGSVSYSNCEPLKRDIENLKIAVEATQPVDVFMNSASPGPSQLRSQQILL